jgi:hypothetical protein
MRSDVQRDTSPRELQEHFDRAAKLRSELHKKENRIKRQAQQLAWGLADLMEPGEHHHRIGLSIHAFEVEGRTCLASGYLEERGDKFNYRYAVLCGGEPARRALKTAPLDPGDSDEPGPHRRVGLATYDDYEDFVDRLPRYLKDVIRDLETQLEDAKAIELQNEAAGKQIRSAAKRFGRQKPAGSGPAAM